MNSNQLSTDWEWRRIGRSELRTRQMRFLNVQVGCRHIDRGATETARPSTGKLRRQRQASVMHGVFPSRPSTLAAICGEVGFGASREVRFPRRFESGPRLIEGCRVAGAGPTVVQRIEAAVPSPLRNAERQARLNRDRADLNVTVENMPAVGAFGVRAGMAPLNRGGSGIGKPLQVGAWPVGAPLIDLCAQSAAGKCRIANSI
jgi:hypothetical protein